MMKHIPTTGIGRNVWATTIASLLVLGTACVVDDPEGEDGSTSAATTDAPTTAATTAPTTASTVDPPATGSGGSEEGSTSAADSGSTTESSDDTSTGGSGICEIMLPPPVACSLAPRDGSSRSNWLAYDRAMAGFDPATDLLDPVEPAGGGMMGFIEPPDEPMVMECDVFTQDCPMGDKCLPWANDGGGSWNATRCGPVQPMPDMLGESCTVEGSAVSGVDSCDVGHMCWDVDTMTNQGTCVELCGCALENPVCNTPNTICSISNGGVLALCLGVCNPLDPAACEAGQGCYPSGEYFQCAPDASGGSGLPGDPCEFINTCEPGTVCVGAGAVPGCAGSGCCSTVCDIDDGAGPCLAGQDCVPWYGPGGAPDECLGEVGVCSVPA